MLLIPVLTNEFPGSYIVIPSFFLDYKKNLNWTYVFFFHTFIIVLILVKIRHFFHDLNSCVLDGRTDQRRDTQIEKAFKKYVVNLSSSCRVQHDEIKIHQDPFREMNDTIFVYVLVFMTLLRHRTTKTSSPFGELLISCNVYGLSPSNMILGLNWWDESLLEASNDAVFRYIFHCLKVWSAWLPWW